MQCFGEVCKQSMLHPTSPSTFCSEDVLDYRSSSKNSAEILLFRFLIPTCLSIADLCTDKHLYERNQCYVGLSCNKGKMFWSTDE